MADLYSTRYPIEFFVLWKFANRFLWDSAPVIVADEFIPKTAMDLEFGLSRPSVWSFDNPCNSLAGCYPINMDDHWFGLFLDMTGDSFPVQYKKKLLSPKVIVTVCGKYTLEWIDGDPHLSYVVSPLIATELIRTAWSQENDNEDGYFLCVMDEVERCNTALIQRVQSIQKLKTGRSRKEHFMKCYDFERNVLQNDMAAE